MMYENLVFAPNMAPSRGLLYYFLSIINVHFRRILPDVIFFFVCFEELYFQMVFLDVLQVHQSQIQKKSIHHRLCRHYLVCLRLPAAKLLNIAIENKNFKNLYGECNASY